MNAIEISGIWKLETDEEELIGKTEVQIHQIYPLKFFLDPKFALHKYLKVARSWIQRKAWYVGPYAGVDYNLTLCRLQSRLQHHTMGNPSPESTLTLCRSRLYSPISDLGFGLWTKTFRSDILQRGDLNKK